MRLFKHAKNEKGALSFEFLGILPFFFMFFLILWQVVASGYAIHSIKAAANEGAKTFAATQDIDEAQETILESLGGSSVISYKNMTVTYLEADGSFELELKVNHPLVFVPNKWKPETSITLDETVVSQVLVE